MDLSPTSIFVLIAMVLSFYFMEKHKVLPKPNIGVFGMGNKCDLTMCKLAGMYSSSRSHHLSYTPCKDFHTYVCKHWTRRDRIPPHNDEWNQFLETRHQVEDKFIDTLREDWRYGSFRNMKEKLLHFYYGCTSDACSIFDEARRANRYETLKNILINLGGFSLINFNSSWNNDTYHFEDGLAYAIRELNIRDVLFKFDVVKDLNSSSNIIYLGNPSYGYPINLVRWSEEHFRSYENKIRRIMFPLYNYYLLEKKVKGDSSFDTRITEIIQFEHKLAKVNLHHPYKKESPYKLFSKNRVFLHEIYSDDKVNITRLLKNVFGNLNDSYINDKTEIVLGENMEAIISVIRQGHPRTLANYIAWRVISEFAEAAHLCDEYNGNIMETYKKISTYTCSIKGEDSCHRYCSDFIFDYFDRAVELINMRNVNNFTAVKKDIEDLFFVLKTALKAGITHSTVLDERNKIRSLFKVEAMKVEIMDPYDKLNEDKVYEYYKDFNDTYNFFKSLILIRKIKATKILDSVNNHNLTNSWIHYSNLFEPYYDQVTNTITIPSALISIPYYVEDVPLSVKYGGLGTVIVREMFKAVDTYGLEINERGQLRKISPNIGIPYVNKTEECIRGLCLNLKDPLDKVCRQELNSTAAFEEQIAEVAVVHIAYQAFKLRSENSEVIDLFVTEVSPEQLFFMSYAYTMCNFRTPEANYRMYKKFGKTQLPFKTTSAAMYTDEFKDVFNCDKAEKFDDRNCTIWKLKKLKFNYEPDRITPVLSH